MTTYYRTTTPKPVLLKLEAGEEMYVWENGQWEPSFFWWETIQSSGFTAYETISKQNALDIQAQDTTYA